MPKTNGFIASKLSFCVWNVGGLISKFNNKLQDNLFINEICEFDIVLLTETHLGYNTPICIGGYKYYPVCRSQSSNGRFYGGLGILLKNKIRPGVKILQNNSKDYQ